MNHDDMNTIASVVAWLRGQEWAGEKPTRGQSADAIESLSAQVAELQKENHRILTSHVALMKEADARTETAEAQVAELKKALAQKDGIQSGLLLARDILKRNGFKSANVIEMQLALLDAAKEGK